MCAQIEGIKKSLQPQANSTPLGHSAAANGDGVDGFSNGSHSARMQRQLPPSYAKVVSSDLADAVKLAVSESLDKQRKVQRINSTVALYGMPDNGQD